jgi:DNA (cytosine-5)-methyltransferase 1
LTGLVLDPFAGPGGWSEGLRQLGRQDIGFETDAAACATRRAAGHLTIRADVATYPVEHLQGKIEGLIASPPCTAFSSAGKRDGINGATGNLIFEVPRWVEAIRPMWVACEQVPEVLSYWRMFAERFRALGFSVWCGILCSADFGVPQERYRAILMAHRGKVVHPPTPTHSETPEDGLFGPALLPWISMAEGLGWKADYRRRRGAGMIERHGPRADAPADAPAPTITSKARTDVLVVKGTAVQHPTERTADRPAPALSFGHNAAGWTWEPGTVINTRQKSLKGGQRTEDYTRKVERPSPTLTGQAGGFWQWERPATTVCADPRITARCHHDNGTQGANAKSTEQVQEGDYSGTEPVRLTVEEALTLQGFDPAYPVQGSRTKQFEQVGNAIPPPLAHAILAALI